MKKAIITFLAIIAALNICAADFDSALQRARAKYTKEKPLVVICDWEFAPFTYLNDEGKNSGAAVEMITEILEKAEINYEVKMRSWTEVVDIFTNKKADISSTCREASQTWKDCSPPTPLFVHTISP